MSNLACLVLGIGAAALLSGCEGTTENGSMAPSPNVPFGHRHVKHDSAPPAYVYVTNIGTMGNPDQLLVYPAGVPNPQPIANQVLGTSTGPFGVATDHEGDVYVALFGTDTNNPSTIDIFSRGGGQLIGTLNSTNGIGQPKGLTVDTFDNLYVLNTTSNSIKVYAHGATQPFIIIHTARGSKVDGGVATDSSNNLYFQFAVGFDYGVEQCTSVMSPPVSCAVLGPVDSSRITGIAIDGASELAVSSGSTLLYFAPPTFHLVKSTRYNNCDVNYLTAGPDESLYVPLECVGSATSSVQVIPNGINAPYLIQNGITDPAGATAGT